MAYTTIDKPTDYFNTVLWSGNNTSHPITGVGFQPDLVWIKERSSTSAHRLFNLIMGAGLSLTSNDAGSQTSVPNALTSFDSDGFTVDNDNGTNETGQTYVGWNWLASNTTAANTDGSITSSVSANTTAGFSIVSWTGTGANGTIGHGLGTSPSMIIVKARGAVKDWMVGHNSMGWTKYINLNTTSAESTASTVWQDTSPTSSVFSVGSSSDVNTSSTAMIAYCFAEKKGFSKFGSYVGNGSTDGTFVYTGFKPAMVITKCSSTSSTYTVWGMWDNKRSPFNVADKQLASNLSDEENSATIGSQYIDMLSNGFKCRNSGSSHNISGQTFIYLAFAENPFTTSTGIPTTAR
jgi:hypothetical protein